MSEERIEGGVVHIWLEIWAEDTLLDLAVRLA